MNLSNDWKNKLRVLMHELSGGANDNGLLEKGRLQDFANAGAGYRKILLAQNQALKKLTAENKALREVLKEKGGISDEELNLRIMGKLPEAGTPDPVPAKAEDPIPGPGPEEVPKAKPEGRPHIVLTEANVTRVPIKPRKAKKTEK